MNTTPRGKFSATHCPRGKPWTAEHIGVLGAAPDGETARRLGRSRLAVCLKRRELGIPAALPPGRPSGTRKRLNGRETTAEPPWALIAVTTHQKKL